MLEKQVTSSTVGKSLKEVMGFELGLWGGKEKNTSKTCQQRGHI